MSGKTLSVNEKTKALTTYNPFPFEEAEACLTKPPEESLDPDRAVLMSIGRLPEDSRYHQDGDRRITSRDSVLIQQTKRQGIW